MWYLCIVKENKAVFELLVSGHKFELVRCIRRMSPVLVQVINNVIE